MTQLWDNGSVGIYRDILKEGDERGEISIFVRAGRIEIKPVPHSGDRTIVISIKEHRWRQRKARA